MPSSSLLYWQSLLSACRDARERSSTLSFNEIRDEFAIHLSEVVNVLQDYSTTLQMNEENATQRGDSVLIEKEGGEERAQVKRQILISVRCALRFGISCISLASPAVNNDSVGPNSSSSSVRSRIQEEAVIGHNLHKALAQVLSCRGMDSKSRVLGSRLLSNLVTANAATSAIVTKDILLSPSDSYRTRQVLNTMALSGSAAPDNQSLDNVELNWVDMISIAAREGNTGREALAGIVAALFNTMVATQDKSNGTCSKAQANALPALIALDKALMCAFMRQMLPADTIKPTATSDGGKDHTGARTSSTTSDDATEWISLLIMKISSYGYFPDMYQATGVGTENKFQDGVAAIITPEQIVLLHCVSSSLDDWADDTSAEADACPMGGALGQQTIISSCRFLANHVKVLRQSLTSTNDAEAYEGEKDCRISAYLSMLEMLATMLGSDDINKAKDHIFCRIYLGKETPLLSDAILELGVLVDKLSIANRAVKARELMIDNDDQRLAVVLVRLIGNMCYKCVSNQDIVRETQVPFPDTSNIPVQVSDSGPNIARSGLHVLLSCTSFSYGCFTLREWALVAIRNVLDNNKQNQNVVYQLEAQKTVDTPELNELGIKTVLDEQGKVRVEPRG